MKARKNKVKHINSVDPIERLLGGFDFGSNTAEKRKVQEGVLEEGKEIFLSKTRQKEEESEQEKAYIEPAINYAQEVIRTSEKTIAKENQELEAQLKEIMLEIKKLADSSKELQTQFKDVAIEQHIVKPGKYHKNFFTWLLSIIRTARQKVEDSGAWLAAMQSKKKARQYGAMAKKHGTSFTLNNERNVATQVG